MHGFLFMEQICIGFAMLKSFGAIQVSLHGTVANVTFKSANDNAHFVRATCGATMDSEFTAHVELNTFLGSLDKRVTTIL